MPPVVPLPPGEPAQIGPYHLIGQLAPAVYVARSATGDEVVVKWFRRHLDDPRKLATLRHTGAIGTALILDTGPDYVVSEHVDGPSLEETEPVSGPALHRLAIALMTSIIALHRAGIRHGDIRPDQVLMGPDGPRLLCHGARAETPAWRSPEELRGHPVGPPADLFAWAACIVFAATGRSPFATDVSTDVSTDGSTEVSAHDVSAHDGRLVHGAADLGPLDGELRELVADCLAALPAERPTADEALLRLIGHSGALNTMVPSISAATRPASRRPSALVLAAAGLAIALVSGGAAYALTPRPVAQAESVAVLSPDGPATSPGPATTPGPVGTPTAFPSPPQATKEIALPSGGTVYEHPDDPVHLTSYQVSPDEKSTASYARTGEGGAFERSGGNSVLAVMSPGGRWLATLNTLYFVESERQSVFFTDRTTGTRFSVPILARPYYTLGPVWSRDGKRLLLTVLSQNKDAASAHPKGFLIVDPGTRQSRFIETANDEDVKAYLALAEAVRYPSFFQWSPNGAGVVASYVTPEGAYGVRFWDLSGRVIRSMHWVGRLIGTPDSFSPSGRLFTTTVCEKTTPKTCVRDTATGERKGTISVKPDSSSLTWYDENHVIQGYWTDNGMFRVVVLDFQGKEVRVLAELKSVKGGLIQLWFTRN